MKNKTTIVIEALQSGLPVTLDGIVYRLFKEGDMVPTQHWEQDVVIAPYFLGTPAPQGNQYFGTPLSFIHFLAICDNLSDEDALAIAAITALKGLPTIRPPKS